MGYLFKSLPRLCKRFTYPSAGISLPAAGVRPCRPDWELFSYLLEMPSVQVPLKQHLVLWPGGRWAPLGSTFSVVLVAEHATSEGREQRVCREYGNEGSLWSEAFHGSKLFETHAV